MQKFIYDRLDVLVCNAGVMALPAQTGKDGYEIQFATNHLAHALLIKLLLYENDFEILKYLKADLLSAQHLS